MAREFRLPDIGEGLVEVEILAWHVPVGGKVAVDQPLVEVETDKAVTEIPSPYAGTVVQHGAAAGQVLAVGQVLVVIGDTAENGPAPADGRGSTSGDAAPIVGSLAEEPQHLPPVATTVPARGGRPQALPPVRRLAKEYGVDLRSVAGSGPGGRITRADVLAAAKPAARAAAPVTPAAPITEPVPRADDERRPLSKLRRTIAANMSRSWSEIPHVTAFDEVDATRLLAVRTALQNRHERPVPVDALVVAAVVPSLRAVPVFNSSLDGDDLVLHGRHDIGVAVDTPDGLIVAVVRDAGSKSVLELAAEVRRLGERARTRTLTPAEVTGQTFTVSNIGAAAGGYGTPIIPSGTMGILSVGRAKERPVARHGKIEIAPVMPLSLSYDHRLADGAVGRRFLAMVIENLAEPALFLA